MTRNFTLDQRACTACGDSFQPRSNRQMWCKNCVPHKKARHLMTVYGLTWPAYQMAVSDPCPLCGLPASVIDHDHATGRARGALCRACNLGLNRFEDPEWRLKAERYLAEADMGGLKKVKRHKHGPEGCTCYGCKQANFASGMLAAGRRTARGK